MPTQYAGGTNINQVIAADSRFLIQTNVAAQLVTAGWTNLSNATAASTGPGNGGTCTMTIASPCVVTFNSHGFLGGERIRFTTTGALPTGLVAGTIYFVKFVNSNTFNVAATSGGANINTSGAQSGTHTVCTESHLLQSATTPQGIAINVRIKDNGGNCVTFSIENIAGTVVGRNSTTNGGQLLAGAAKTYRVVANKYQFFIFVPIGNPSGNRGFVAGGVPYVPAPVTVPTGGGGWFTSASNLDTDAQTRVCFRTTLGTSGGSTNIQPCCQGIWAASIFDVGNADFTGNNNYMSNIHIPIPYNVNGIRTMSSGGQVDYRWDSDHIVTWDAFLSWTLSGSLGGEAKLRAQLWDATVICDSFTGDATTSFDSKNWIAVTDVGTWTLFLVIP